MERELNKTRESEAQQASVYELGYQICERKRRRAEQGKVVIKGSERPWVQGRQGLLKHFVAEPLDDTAVLGWHDFFVHDIRSHSGKHRHQGGLAIYVIEGRGWTVVDRVRHDWEEGDLILLPLKPGGVEHQHFNAEPGKPCKWLGIIHGGMWDALGNQMEQKEESPELSKL